MRVLMTADTVGGVWTYALELARALAPHGVRSPWRRWARRLSAVAVAGGLRRCPTLTVYESALRSGMDGRPVGRRAAGRRLAAGLESALRPDVIHLNGYAHGALPWRAPALIVGHSCVLSWWRAVKGEDAPPDWDRYRQAVTAGLQARRSLAAPTQAMLDALRSALRPAAADRR